MPMVPDGSMIECHIQCPVFVIFNDFKSAVRLICNKGLWSDWIIEIVFPAIIYHSQRTNITLIANHIIYFAIS